MRQTEFGISAASASPDAVRQIIWDRGRLLVGGKHNVHFFFA